MIRNYYIFIFLQAGYEKINKEKFCRGKNLFLNNLRIIFSFLLPLITFPYTSRVLGPKMFERVDYAISIVAYFILFATLGIVKFGIRTIAGVRDYKEMLSIAVAELLLILTVSTIIISIIYSFAFFFFFQMFF